MSRFIRLAVRNVSRNRRRSLITGIAIVVAVVMVMILRGFVDGAGRLMVSDVVDGRSGALQVHRKGYVDSIEAVPIRLNIPFDQELLEKIKAVPNVKGVAGRIMFNGLVGNGRSQTMFIGRALDVAHEEEACPRAKAVVKAGGQPLTNTDTNATLLGFELAESFGSQLGSSVSVQASSPSGRINAIDFTIKGFTVSSLPFENKRVLTIPLATAQSLLGLQGRVTEYAIGVHDLSQLEKTRVALQQALGDEYEVHAWHELNTFVRDVINRQNAVFGVISVVLFVIALTVIANTMLMSVFERIREIGTLLAVGVRRAQVLRLFMWEAAVIGATGGVIGASIGATILAVLYRVGIPIEMPGTSGQSLLQPSVTVQFIFVAVLMATLGALAASALPARRASRLNPVDALRNA